jgi:benzoylformate decarboxylase
MNGEAGMDEEGAPVKAPQAIGPASVRAAVHAFMRGHGMTTVFGNPGSTELKFFRDWPADFRYVLGLQESCCVAMADGYAQATRNAAFVNLHSAAGVGHALGSVFTAWRNQTPLVITAGQQTRAMFPTDPYLYASQAAEFPKPYVKFSVEPARAADVPAAIARAYYLAMQKPCGPTFVSVPEDDWDEPAEALAPRRVAFDIAPDPEALAALAAAVDASVRPVIVVGAAVDQDGAWDLAVELAERIEAPVWASPMSGRASFPEDHRLFAGHLPPVRAQLAAKLAGHDLVLVLGAPVFTFHVHTPGGFVPAGAVLWQLTDDPEWAARSPVGASVRCSMGLGLSRLVATLATRRRPAAGGRAVPPAPVAAQAPTGAWLMHAIARLMPPDAVIVEEVPTHRGVLRDFLPIRASGAFYAGASGGLGWAVPAAVGVALAESRRKVVCLVGDGSSLYSIQALWTAMAHKLPVAFVIFNNGGYGALKSFGAMLGIPEAPGNDLAGLDFVALARGFGCTGECVENFADTERALREAFAANEPRLVEVRLADGVERLY